ncbi:MAG: serine hydrolase [bacterium]
MKRFFMLFAFCFMFISAYCFPQTNKLDSLLQIVKSNYGVLGMSVAVIKTDSLVFNKGYGIRDVGRNLPVDNNTMYRIASISKFITTTTLMTLWDEGLFNVDDDISKYIGFILRNPNFPNDTITIRKLLSHTSSLLDGDGYDTFLSATAGTNPPKLESLLKQGGAYYTSNMFQNKSPKAGYFEYANINFGVIGTLIEKLTGKRFDIVVREKVLIPLGINGSFNIQDIAVINDVSALYRKSGNVWSAQVDNYKGVKPPPRNLSNYVIGTNGIIFSPTGGLRISSADLAKIMVVFLNNGLYGSTHIISEAAANLMQKTVWTYNGSNGDTMYGIFKKYAFANHTTTDLLPGETLIGHPGEAYGLVSDMYFSKIKDYGVVFICNGGNFTTGAYSGWYALEENIYKAAQKSLTGFITDVEESKNITVNNFELKQNYPNPFNPSTAINFSLSAGANTSLIIYDVLGCQAAILFDEYKESGSYTVKIDAGKLNLTSGVYFYQIISGNFKQTKKMLFLK